MQANNVARQATASTREPFLSIPLTRLIPTVAILSGLFVGALILGWREGDGVALQLSLILGAITGILLQRARFCFQCMWTDWLDRRDPRGLLAIVLALAVGAIGYTIIFGAWLPDPSGTRLPPTAHISPVSYALILAGLAFGAGMAISGSCISAHLYRLGEGAPVSPFALIGVCGGFIFGFLTWNSLYLSWIFDASPLWLPRYLGYGGTLIAVLAALLGLAIWLLRSLPEPTQPEPCLIKRILINRWPAWMGGLGIGLVGTVAYLRLSPLGVTAEIGARSRQVAAAFGWIPARLEGLDILRGCATVIRDGFLTPNGMFVLGLVLAAFAAALISGTSRRPRPNALHMIRGLIGGVLLGWGSLTGLGCTIGTLLSGISAGAVSGWVFALTVLIATTTVTLAGRRLRLLP